MAYVWTSNVSDTKDNLFSNPVHVISNKMLNLFHCFKFLFFRDFIYIHIRASLSLNLSLLFWTFFFFFCIGFSLPPFSPSSFFFWFSFLFYMLLTTVQSYSSYLEYFYLSLYFGVDFVFLCNLFPEFSQLSFQIFLCPFLLWFVGRDQGVGWLTGVRVPSSVSTVKYVYFNKQNLFGWVFWHFNTI